MEFKRGERVAPLKVTGPSTKTGTEITFLPATETFTNIDFHFDLLSKRIRELSFLNNGVKIDLIDHRTGRTENFEFSGGIKGFVEYMNRLLIRLLWFAQIESPAKPFAVLLALLCL